MRAIYVVPVIVGITMVISGLIIFSHAENSLAQQATQIEVEEKVSLSQSPERDFSLRAERSVSSSFSGTDVESSFIFIAFPVGCVAQGSFEGGEYIWSLEEVELNFDSVCGLVDITVEATDDPVTLVSIGDCSTSTTLETVISTITPAEYEGVIIAVSGFEFFVDGVGEIEQISSTFTPCR